jgi:carbamoyl-phosphate synthase large subunit
MGIDRSFEMAFAKAEEAAYSKLPTQGKVFITVRDKDKRDIILIAKKLQDMNCSIVATEGTHKLLTRNGVRAERVFKIREGGRPNILDLIRNGEISLIINTPTKRGQQTDEAKIRGFAVLHNIPRITTIAAARAAVSSIEAAIRGEYEVTALQDYHKAVAMLEQTATKR